MRSPGAGCFYWGVRHEEDFFARAEIEALCRETDCHLVLFLSDPPQGWTGARGRITPAILDELPRLASPTFYLVGNGAMITELKRELVARGINRKKQIRTEAFLTRRLLLSATAFAGAIALAGPGCGEDAPAPLIIGVTPEGAYTDGPLVLRVDAIQVRPAVRLDVGRGALATDLSSLRISLIPEDPIGAAIPVETADWDGQHGFWVRTPAALPAGVYGLELVDASGQSARLSQAFEGLGPDPDAPSIVVLSLMNNGYMATGASKTVTILADDGPPLEAWRASRGWPRASPAAPARRANPTIHHRPASAAPHPTR